MPPPRRDNTGREIRMIAQLQHEIRDFIRRFGPKMELQQQRLNESGNSNANELSARVLRLICSDAKSSIARFSTGNAQMNGRAIGMRRAAAAGAPNNNGCTRSRNGCTSRRRGCGRRSSAGGFRSRGRAFQVQLVVAARRRAAGSESGGIDARRCIALDGRRSCTRRTTCASSSLPSRRPRPPLPTPASVLWLRAEAPPVPPLLLVQT